MKTIGVLLAASAALVAFGATAIAADEVTKEGTATCAKCDLGTEKECTNVLQVGEEIFYLDGETGKSWHKNICKGSKEVKVTGTIEKRDGKTFLVTTKVEIKE